MKVFSNFPSLKLLGREIFCLYFKKVQKFRTFSLLGFLYIRKPHFFRKYLRKKNPSHLTDPPPMAPKPWGFLYTWSEFLPATPGVIWRALTSPMLSLRMWRCVVMPFISVVSPLQLWLVSRIWIRKIQGHLSTPKHQNKPRRSPSGTEGACFVGIGALLYFP